MHWGDLFSKYVLNKSSETTCSEMTLYQKCQYFVAIWQFITFSLYCRFSFLLNARFGCSGVTLQSIKSESIVIKIDFGGLVSLPQPIKLSGKAKRLKDILVHAKIPSLLNIIITTPQFVNWLYCICTHSRFFIRNTKMCTFNSGSLLIVNNSQEFDYYSVPARCRTVLIQSTTFTIIT